MHIYIYMCVYVLCCYGCVSRYCCVVIIIVSLFTLYIDIYRDVET